MRFDGKITLANNMFAGMMLKTILKDLITNLNLHLFRNLFTQTNDKTFFARGLLWSGGENTSYVI